MLGTTDPFTNFVGTLAFWVSAVASISAAYLMVASIKNLIRAALALTTVLGGVALMYALLGADFLAIAQLSVYIGAIMVLIIFAIFMTPGQIDVPGLVGRGQRLARGTQVRFPFAGARHLAEVEAGHLGPAQPDGGRRGSPVPRRHHMEHHASDYARGRVEVL